MGSDSRCGMGNAQIIGSSSIDNRHCAMMRDGTKPNGEVVSWESFGFDCSCGSYVASRVPPDGRKILLCLRSGIILARDAEGQD